MSQGSFQSWTVPASGKYKITAYGAQGGSGKRIGEGGLGAKMEGNFSLDAGEELIIGVGNQGTAQVTNFSVGGGGASFVGKKGQGVSISTENGTVENVSIANLRTAKLRAVLKTTDTGNMRILNTPNDEAFAFYMFHGGSSINAYSASAHENFDAVITINDGNYHLLEWFIDFDNGIGECTADGDESKKGSFTFAPQANVPVSAFEVFVRDGSSQFSGDCLYLELEVNGEPFFKHTDFKVNATTNKVMDSIGNRNITWNGSAPSNFITIMKDPLIIAGGGGAYGVGTTNTFRELIDGHVDSWGKEGFGNNHVMAGGTNGSGGTFVTGNHNNKLSGAGYLSGGGFSQPLITGGLGGVYPSIETDPSDGGYGGGGAGGDSGGFGSCGGGGGYSGGGGGYAGASEEVGAGGGGGSLNTGTAQNNESGVQSGNGLVIIQDISGKIRGVVFGAFGPAQKTVLVYDRTTGELINVTESDSITGEFTSYCSPGTQHFCVVLDDEKNALVYDKLEPEAS